MTPDEALASVGAFSMANLRDQANSLRFIALTGIPGVNANLLARTSADHFEACVSANASLSWRQRLTRA
jgi:hypothetical protein